MKKISAFKVKLRLNIAQCFSIYNFHNKEYNRKALFFKLSGNDFSIGFKQNKNQIKCYSFYNFNYGLN
jgi:hypothetical protein